MNANTMTSIPQNMRCNGLGTETQGDATYALEHVLPDQ